MLQYVLAIKSELATQLSSNPIVQDYFVKKVGEEFPELSTNLWLHSNANGITQAIRFITSANAS
ncbi:MULTISPECIES: hypothetical protein [Nostocales]|uniref:hypothetical protein n=1 Tax=Nostocales TaxID=1161 RepID=UPI0016847173|nr:MULTISPECIES: hypothetical protein [Nostocales]